MKIKRLTSLLFLIIIITLGFSGCDFNSTKLTKEGLGNKNEASVTSTPSPSLPITSSKLIAPEITTNIKILTPEPTDVQKPLKYTKEDLKKYIKEDKENNRVEITVVPGKSLILENVKLIDCKMNCRIYFYGVNNMRLYKENVDLNKYIKNGNIYYIKEGRIRKETSYSILDPIPDFNGKKMICFVPDFTFQTIDGNQFKIVGFMSETSINRNLPYCDKTYNVIFKQMYGQNIVPEGDIFKIICLGFGDVPCSEETIREVYEISQTKGIFQESAKLLLCLIEEKLKENCILKQDDSIEEILQTNGKLANKIRTPAEIIVLNKFIEGNYKIPEWHVLNGNEFYIKGLFPDLFKDNKIIYALNEEAYISVITAPYYSDTFKSTILKDIPKEEWETDKSNEIVQSAIDKELRMRLKLEETYRNGFQILDYAEDKSKVISDHYNCMQETEEKNCRLVTIYMSIANRLGDPLDGCREFSAAVDGCVIKSSKYMKYLEEYKDAIEGLISSGKANIYTPIKDVLKYLPYILNYIE